MNDEPTAQDIARQLFPTLDQEQQDIRQAELQRPWAERMENSEAFAKWDRDVWSPWKLRKTDAIIARNETYGNEARTATAIGTLLDNFRQLGHRAAEADFKALADVCETEQKADYTEGDRLRAAQRAIADTELPRLKEKRAKQRKEVLQAEKDLNDWLKRNPQPAQPYFQIRPAMPR